MANPTIRPQQFLANLPLFSELSESDLDQLATGTRELRAARGDILFNRGDPCVGFHVVVYGQVKLAFISPQGAEKVVEIIGPRMSFGEALMFTDRPYVVYAQALQDSLLMFIDKATVNQCIESDPRFARRMIAGLSMRLHALVRDVEAYSMQSGTQRVIGFLLNALPLAPSMDPDGAADAEPAFAPGPQCITLPAGKNVIASRLTLTPEHFSRILHDLSSHGLIAIDGRDIIIHDVSRLQSHGV